MARGSGLVLRSGVATLSASLVVAGIFAALRNGDAGPGAPHSGTGVLAAPTSRATLTWTTQPVAARTPPAAGEASPTPGTASPTAAAEDAPATAEPLRTSGPAATPSAVTVAQPAATTDLPIYRDVHVLGLAAEAVLPSGKTFRECVEAPPSSEHWPTPVHLYYEGNGRWLIETHLSEVQVVFSEASGSFTPGNFAPPNEGCR